MTDPTQLAIPFFLLALALEALVARRLGRRIADARDRATSLAMGVGSVIVGLLWQGTLLAFYTVLHRHRALELGTGSAVFLLALVADDFAYYWFHRFHHEVRVLWASHVPHHSSERYNLATALRQSWFPVTALPFYAPLVLLGFDPLLLLAAHGVNLLYQFWIHTELIDRMPRWFEAVFNTPSHHRVHHGSNARYLDRNYGGILIVWDRLFGTFEPESEPVRYGLTKNIGTYNPFRAEFHEWLAIARDVARARSLADATRFALGRPGWQPSDSSGWRAPGARLRPRRARPATADALRAVAPVV
jgi:sterol desaturase/sphingolipid hydroxylase (fatty acid hydroxylase superfamily)